MSSIEYRKTFWRRHPEIYPRACFIVDELALLLSFARKRPMSLETIHARAEKVSSVALTLAQFRRLISLLQRRGFVTTTKKGRLKPFDADGRRCDGMSFLRLPIVDQCRFVMSLERQDQASE